MYSNQTDAYLRSVTGIAGLNPGVRLVPAHVMGLGLAQERGFTYMKP